MQLSQTLFIKEQSVCCSHCQHSLATIEKNWKYAANLDEQNLQELGSPHTTGAEVILRKFSCPGCGSLLDSEIAMPEDPFLEDFLFAS
jgi:acetone carboxylase gamma subunit